MAELGHCRKILWAEALDNRIDSEALPYLEKMRFQGYLRRTLILPLGFEYLSIKSCLRWRGRFLGRNSVNKWKMFWTISLSQMEMLFSFVVTSPANLTRVPKITFPAQVTSRPDQVQDLTLTALEIRKCFQHVRSKIFNAFQLRRTRWKDENEKFVPRFDDRENIKNMSERKKTLGALRSNEMSVEKMIFQNPASWCDVWSYCFA